MSVPAPAPIEGAKVGIIGGTFNPIHIAHLRSATEVCEALGLERMLFVPSARPPHKDAHGVDPIAPAEVRLEWVRAAVAEDPRFEVSAIEVDRQGPSFLVDTLAELGTQLSELPVFVTGLDAFSDIGNWRAPRALFTLAHFAVTLRPPVLPGGLAEWLPEIARGDFDVARDGHSARHRQADSELRVVPITALDVSASDIRARLRRGQSVRYLLPESIRSAVESSGFYGSARA